MNKLTKREKVLLYFLAVVLLGAGLLYFAVIPAADAGTEADASLEEQEMTLGLMEDAVSMVSTREAAAAQAAARVESLAGSFRPACDNEELDRFITGMLQTRNLEIQQLIIEDGVAGSADCLTRIPVSVTAVGSWADFTALSQDIADTMGVRLASFSLRSRGGDRTLVDNAGFTVELHLTVTVYDAADGIPA